MIQVVTQLMGAINTRALYPAGHPRVTAAIDQLVRALRDELARRGSDSLTFLVVGDDLVVEGEVIRQTMPAERHLIQMFGRRGIERLTLGEGLDAEEAGAFVAAIATQQTPDSSPHIVLGRVEIGVDADEGSTEDDDSERRSWTDHLANVREAFATFRAGRSLPIASMEQLVWGLIDSLSHSTASSLPLAKLKEHDEYTFIHSVNVSLLVLAQARSFGIRGQMLHAFGMAALLHDVGKLMVPIEVLNAPGKLEGDEWTMMQSHAEKGASYLSGVDGSAPLSIVVAYEHHMRYDGKPNYPKVEGTRMPNLATRMTSIADVYDALSTVRPYREASMRSTALQIMRDRVGTFYDPLLVANFVQLVEADDRRAAPPR